MRLKDLLGIFDCYKKRYDDTHNFTCDVCGKEVFENERVCKACLAALPKNDKIICPYCGRRIKEEGVCLDCKEKRIAGIKKARSACIHEGEAARLVLRFKNGEKYLYRTLSSLMLPILSKEFPEADAVTFVPMTKKAEKKRGYNQARLLAEELAEKGSKAFLSPAEKRKETRAQKTLCRKDREENLKGCFRVTDRKSVTDRRIVIVDDTMTTGSTAGELAMCLRRAGAAAVYLLTFTSVPKKDLFGKI